MSLNNDKGPGTSNINRVVGLNTDVDNEIEINRSYTGSSSSLLVPLTPTAKVGSTRGSEGTSRDNDLEDTARVHSLPSIVVDRRTTEGSKSGFANENQSIPPRKTKERLTSLDGVRGLTVAIMILVDMLGDWFPSINHSPWDDITLADFVMPFFLFMVGCSMTFTFRNFKGGRTKLLRKVLWRTFKLFVLGIITQGADLFKVQRDGLDFSTTRIPGILQRIAWAYFVTALIVMYIPKLGDIVKTTQGANYETYALISGPPRHRHFLYAFHTHALHWLAALLFFFIYLAVMLGTHVPTFTFTVEDGRNYTVKCDMAGDLTPACSAARLVDTTLLSYNHLYGSGEFSRLPECSACGDKRMSCPKPPSCGNCKPGSAKTDCAPNWCFGRLDPEGVIASFPTILTTFIGYHFGIILSYYKDHHTRMKHWLSFSLVLLLLGITIHSSVWKANKQIWSPAYLFIMAGANGFVLVAFYMLLDWRTWQPKWLNSQLFKIRGRSCTPTDMLRPLVWVGLNTIFVYLMAPSADIWGDIQTNFYWKTPDNNLRDAAYRAIFCDSTYSVVNGGHYYDEDSCYNAINVKPSPLPCPDQKSGHEHYRSWRYGGVVDCLKTEKWCGSGMFKGQKEKSAQLLWVLCQITFWFGIAGFLHHKKWYYAL